MKNIIVHVILLLLVLTQGCKKKEEAAPEKENETSSENSTTVLLTEAQYTNAALTTETMVQTKINQIVTLNGKVEVTPENNTTISSPVSGFVKYLKIIPGMSISKGQTMIVIEDKEILQMQQDYLSAKNGYTFAKLDYERQSGLLKNEAVSEKIVQQAEEKMKQQQIIMQGLSEKLRLIRIDPSALSPENIKSVISIPAPTNGVITEVMANSGKYVHEGEALFQIVSNTGARLVLKAFEKDLPYLRIGQKITAYSNTQPDNKINGKIEYIVHQVNTEGFANIICTLDGSTSAVIPGVYLNAEVGAQNMDAWTLPEDAIIQFEGKEFIFIETSKLSYEMSEVKTGQKENGKIQILNFEPYMGKNIVNKGAYTLLMKLKNVSDE